MKFYPSFIKSLLVMLILSGSFSAASSDVENREFMTISSDNKTLYAINLDSHEIQSFDLAKITSNKAFEVQQEHSITTQTLITSSTRFALIGEPVDLNATVAALSGLETPTGTVQFYAVKGETFSVDIGNVVLNDSGQASLTTTFLEASPYTVYVMYEGENDFSPSLSNFIRISVE